MSSITTLSMVDGSKFPFKLSELKDYLGISHENHDRMLEVLAGSAADLIERITRQPLVRKSFLVMLDFDGTMVYQLPRSPVVGVTEVKGINEDGTKTTLTLNSGYHLRGEVRKTIEFSEYYPIFEIRMSAGWAGGFCPPPLVLACWKQIAFDTENRTGGTLTDEVIKMITPFICYG